MDFSDINRCDCGRDRLAVAPYSKLADGAGVDTGDCRKLPTRRQRVIIRGWPGTGTAATLRSVKKSGRGGLEAGWGNRSVFGAASFAGDLVCHHSDQWVDGPGNDSLEKASRANSA